jgi:osomolarity two-component system sensor histidine kinase TcsA
MYSAGAVYLLHLTFIFLLHPALVAGVDARDWKAYQKVFVDMPDETMFIDSKMIIRAVSRTYVSHIKPPVTPEAIIGTSIADLAVGRVHNENAYIKSIRDVFHTGEKTTILSNDVMGSQYEMESIPIYNVKGRVYAVKHQIKHIILHTSVEYLRLLQTESEKSTWKILVNSLTDYAIFVVSKDFIIQTWSEQCERVYQWKEEEVIGKRYCMLLSNGQSLKRSDSVDEMDESAHTVSHSKKDGITFLVEEKIFPIYSHGVHVGNSVINKDLTAMSQSQSMLIEAREQAQKQQSNFLSSISHESRSNTAIIVSSIETLLDPKSGPLNSYQKGTCEDMYQASKLLLQVVDDILDHASFTKVGIHLKCVAFDLQKLALAVMKLQARALQTDHQKGGIDLSCYVDPEIPKLLYGDEIRISQIITNFVSNGIKFTDEGSVNVRIEKGVPMYPDKTHIIISVADTGVGISEIQRPLLFSPFYQADAGLSRKQTGTGLGLSNTKMLVEAMTGTVTVTSTPMDSSDPAQPHGSIFQCHIHILNQPGKDPSPDLEPKDEGSVKVKRKHLSRQRSYSVPETYLESPLMLVEDNPILARFAQRALTSLGFSNVVWIDDGLKAIVEARETPKDLILMDLSIPGLNGLEATRQIRLFDSRVAIVALTANALQQDKEMCMEAGMNAHLSKPVSTKELKDTIVSHLSRIAAEDTETELHRMRSISI